MQARDPQSGGHSLTRQRLADVTYGLFRQTTRRSHIAERKDEFTIPAELSGMKSEDVSVDCTDGMLTIRGEKVSEKTEKEDDRTYYMWERRFGTFQRTLPFPGGIDDKKIAAEFKDGVLNVRLPKTEEVKPKRQAIPIVTK